MQTGKLCIYLLCAMACAGVACQKKIKTSSFIVGQNLKANLGVGSGGTFTWVSENVDGPEFTIHFTSVSPCKDGLNDLTGGPKGPAVCKVPANSDGVYPYQILTGDRKNSGPDNLYYAYVDGCKGCDIIIKGGPQHDLHPVAPIRSDNPDTVYIDCDSSKAAQATPSTVAASAGQILEWSQIGPETNTWETTLPAGICTNGTTFGTFPGDTALACIIQNNVKPNSYPYSVKLKSCSTGSSAQLTIEAAK